MIDSLVNWILKPRKGKVFDTFKSRLRYYITPKAMEDHPGYTNEAKVALSDYFQTVKETFSLKEMI